MNVCVAGKNNIAINVCEYLLRHYPEIKLYAITNRNDDGIDGWQKSFFKYVNEDSNIIHTELECMYGLADLLFLSTEFDRIIDPKLFRTTRLFNIHFSLLPAYRGVYTSSLPILYGEQYSGVTLHSMDAGIDTGDIIAQERIRITKKETSYTLYLKYIDKGTNLITKNIEKLITGRFNAKPQLPEGASYYSRKSIDYSNLIINLKATASQIDKQIRAFYFPAFQVPIVYSYPIKYTKILQIRSTLRPGLVVRDSKDYIVVSTVDYDIKLYKQI